MNIKPFVAVLFFLATSFGLQADIEKKYEKYLKPAKMMQGKKLPEMKILKWGNLPEGKEEMDLADLKGKTVFLSCFQSW